MVKITKRLLALAVICICSIAIAESPDYGNDQASAEPIVADGSEVVGEISPAGDEDWFTFTPVQYGRYEVTLTRQGGGSYRYCDMYQMDDSGNLGVVDLYPNSGTSMSTTTTNSSTTFVTKENSCYLKVSGVSYTGGYIISIELLDITPLDYYPETFDSPQEIIVGDAPLAGTTCPDNLEGFDLDNFSFATEAGHMYKVSLTRGAINSSAGFGLYDEALNVLASNLTEKIFTATYTGDYYLSVDGGTCSYYEIMVEEIQLVSISANGTEVTGLITEVGDEDWFTFTPVQYGRYEVTLTRQGGGSYRYCDMYQMDDSGNLGVVDLYPNSGTSMSTTTTNSSTTFVTKENSCYLKVSGVSYTGGYIISIELLDITPLDYYPETFDSPQEIIVGDAPLAGTTCPDNLEGFDLDNFSFATEAGHMYKVSLTRGAINSSAGFGLYDEALNVLASNLTEKIFTATYTGDYYLSVDGGTCSYYEIMVEEIQLVSISANGTEVTGLITEVGDEDWFTFTPVQYGRYEVTLTRQGGGSYRYCDMYQMDDSGNLGVVDLYPNSGTSMSTTTTNSSTTFVTKENSCYLKVSGVSYTGGYIISIELLDITPLDYYPETFDSPQEIIVGDAPLAGTTCPDNLEDGDIDSFVFAAEQWKLYEVIIGRDAIGSSASFDLYDSSSNQLTSNNTTSLLFVAPQSGDYFISIDGGTCSFYTIAVEEIETTPIAHDGTMKVNTISSSTDFDWYSFIVPQDGTFNMRYENTTSSYLHFRLYSLTETGALSLVHDATVRAEVENHSLNLTTGLHLIKISDAAGLYKLSVSTPLGPQCGDLEHPYPVGDISGPDGTPDCKVDLSDFAALAENWLIDVNP